MIGHHSEDISQIENFLVRMESKNVKILLVAKSRSLSYGPLDKCRSQQSTFSNSHMQKSATVAH